MKQYIYKESIRQLALMAQQVEHVDANVTVSFEPQKITHTSRFPWRITWRQRLCHWNPHVRHQQKKNHTHKENYQQCQLVIDC